MSAYLNIRIARAGTFPDRAGEYLHKHGMVDMVVHRSDLKATLATLLGYLEPKQAA